MNYASLLLPSRPPFTNRFSDSITTIKCWQEKMWQDTISNSVVWLRYRSSGPPVVFFLSFPPQLSRVDIWWFLKWKQTGSGMVTVVKQKCVLMCFLLQAGEKPSFNQAWVLFFIPNQHVPSWCFRIRRSSFILEGFFSLRLKICSAEFMPSSEMAQLKIFVHWSFCLVAHCHHGVSGPGEAQEGSILAGSGWLWV